MCIHNYFFVDQRFKSQEERLHSVELAREHEYKRLENTMKRYQKAKCVELVPSEFRLATEVDKYISEEGCLLFLTEPLSLADCRNLYCYKVEIEKSKMKLDELNGRDITEVSLQNSKFVINFPYSIFRSFKIELL